MQPPIDAFLDAYGIFAAASFAVAVAVLVLARAGRWARLEDGAPPLVAAAPGVLATLMVVVTPLVSAERLYLLSPLRVPAIAGGRRWAD